ncbi:hypothetical protein EYF80_014146 [Liparis tanakae]|uniref:Uncharacterized protein n=1 Tax=Liparis tanakae TaxID=230148 RepID=A0A4Z2IC68_9TELE|nr:hypothetical protein EYF80_014146 [Liparis tanakae]
MWEAMFPDELNTFSAHFDLLNKESAVKSAPPPEDRPLPMYILGRLTSSWSLLPNTRGRKSDALSVLRVLKPRRGRPLPLMETYHCRLALARRLPLLPCVEIPASWRSSEVFIHSSAAPGVPPLPGVASLARGAAGLGTNGIRQAQQHQQRYHQHCGMAVERRLYRKNGEPLPSSRGPIKVSGPQRSRAPDTSEPRYSADCTALEGIRSSPLLLESPPADLTESFCSD